MKLYRLLLLLAFSILLILCWGCEKLLNNLPEAFITSSPYYGDLETIFTFDASESFDDETESWRLKVRWDADDDGEWDSDYSIEKRFSFQFHSEGPHVVRLEVLDSYGGITQSTDTVMVAPVIKDSVMTDARDNQKYKIVRLYGQWWMSENLSYGTRVDAGTICRDNGIPEYYVYIDSLTGKEKHGGYYTWKEASDYSRDEGKGICPEGWHIISSSDLKGLRDLISPINDKYSYIGRGGIFKLDFDLNGRYFWPGDQWDGTGQYGSIWISANLPFPWFSAWTQGIELRSDYTSVSWVNNWRKEWGEYTFQKIAMPVRCVKDQ